MIARLQDPGCDGLALLQPRVIDGCSENPPCSKPPVYGFGHDSKHDRQNLFRAPKHLDQVHGLGDRVQVWLARLPQHLVDGGVHRNDAVALLLQILGDSMAEATHGDGYDSFVWD